MNTAEILRAAAARVRQGWCQNMLYDPFGGACAGGAIMLTAKGVERNRRIEIAAAISEALRLNDDPLGPWGSMVEWNNSEGQTAENVAAGLEYAALVWEQEQAAKQSELVAVPK